VFDLTSSIRKSSGATPLDRSPCTPACLPLKKCAIVAIVAHQGGGKSYAPVLAFQQEYLSCEGCLNLKPLPKYFGMPCALAVMLRHSRVPQVAKVSIRECSSASIFFVIHLRSNWRAYDDLCTGKLDFARLFHDTQKLLTGSRSDMSTDKAHVASH
jgi:hypothetical protein